jgi:hypothetical protein
LCCLTLQQKRKRYLLCCLTLQQKRNRYLSAMKLPVYSGDQNYHKTGKFHVHEIFRKISQRSKEHFESKLIKVPQQNHQRADYLG